MVKVAVLVLAILTGFDYVKCNGRYMQAALQASTSILHHLGLT
jgi:hypothetical protein